MKRLITAIVIATALLGASFALAGVTVYKNNFSDRSDVGELKRFAGGKGECGKSWKGQKTLGVVVKQGRRECALRTPVEGDGKRPDHTIAVVGKVLKKKTDRKIRKDAYVGVALRANNGSGYELRVFPSGRRWKLIRNGAAVDKGREPTIGALDEKNAMRLLVEGSKVSAKVNGAKLASFRDGAAEEVSGRKTLLTYGITARTRKDAGALFDKLKIQVPDPRR